MRRFANVLLAIAFLLSTPALGDGATTPRWLMSARGDATASLVAAERAASMAAQRRDALESLFEEGHARADEVVAARKQAAVAAAISRAASRWNALLAATQSNADAEFASIAVDGSSLLALPAASDENTQPISTDRDTILRRIIADEADALPITVLDVDHESITAYRDALQQLHAKRHATEDELQSIDHRLAAIETRRADLLQRAARLRQLATDLNHDATPVTPTADDVFANAEALLADVDRSWAHHATLATAHTTLIATIEVTDSAAEQTAAEDWQSRIAKLPESARRPTELAVAERRFRRSKAAAASATARHAVAIRGLAFLTTLEATDINTDWTPYATGDGTAATPVSFTRPVPPQTDSLTRILGPVDLQDRDVTWSAAWGGPRPGRVPKYSVWSDETRAGLRIPSSHRSVVPELTKPSRSYESPYRDLGRTYSSGYAFGQIRTDLPASLRLPRADAYVSPWYFPGSPGNYLRFRNRLPLDARN